MPDAELGFAAVSRAVVAVAADLVADVERRVVGDANVRTAQGNAWAAMCADRARAQARADVDALVATLAARPRGPQPPQGGAEAGDGAPDTTRATGTPAKRSGGRPKGPKAARGQRAVGSSPRSSASQAALVSTR
ncbi:hypothetical protein ACFQFC_14485 [Amorphoplanes digitatis]|uniref:Uncharacterized protein n=1 Tax=Actinoplanes digitatis TaxID=1868 RepID=A0A7W7MSK8_9ACTN|nr:hypothetical protein [Actinoplanes digitatis]